jgi:glutaredoxin
MKSAKQTQRRTHEVVLYTRAGCHLCDDAERTLIEHGLRLAKVDIDDDPTLRERFDSCVPVVEIDGKIRFRGKVNRMLLRRLLK